VKGGNGKTVVVLKGSTSPMRPGRTNIKFVTILSSEIEVESAMTHNILKKELKIISG
jgi:hypothetical protein